MTDNQNVYALFERQYEAGGDRPAFVTAQGESTSYADLARAVARMANALVSMGLKAGAVFNPLNAGYTPAELDYFVGDAEPRVLVCQASTVDVLRPIAQRHGVGSTQLLEPDGSGTLTDRAAAQSERHQTIGRDADDLASLIYTSGTTGRSKGAMITHGNLTSNLAALCQVWRITRDDVLLHALPIFHVHGLFVAINTCLAQGAKLIWLPRFDVKELIRLMPRATMLMGVPTFFTRLLAAPEFGQQSVANMRLFISGSAPLLEETHEAFRTRTGHAILERYGMTEAGMITSNPYAAEARLAGTVGYALPGISLRIADPDSGQPIQEPNQVGVVEIKGPNVCKGYWRNPEKTQAEFRPDGYFVTGDLGTLAADGRLTIVGRAKDLIISGGLNVYPKEIEEELNTMPGVTEAAVVGVPHPDLGEGVIAVLAVSSDGTCPPESDILRQLEARLAKFKVPKRIFEVEDLPRNAMGKVQKAELRKRYEAIFEA